MKIVSGILDKLVNDSQNICECLTLNEMHIKSTSLVIFSINGNLTSPTHHQHLHLKKKNSTVYSTISNFVYLNRNFHLLEI